MFQGIRPMPWMKSASNWFPRTEEWPVAEDLVVPVEQLSENLKQSMGAARRQREENRKVLAEKEKKKEEKKK